MYGLGKEKPFVPIFGCRKRQQRHAAYANPDELSTLPSSNSNISSNHNVSQISIASDFDCFDVPMMADEKPPVTKKKIMLEQKPPQYRQNQEQQRNTFQQQKKPKLMKSFSEKHASSNNSKTMEKTDYTPSFQKQQLSYQNHSTRKFPDHDERKHYFSRQQQGKSLLTTMQDQGPSRKPFDDKTFSYQPGNTQRSGDFGNNELYQGSKPSSSKYVETKKQDDSMMDISTINRSIMVKNKTQSLAPRFISSRVGDIKKWLDLPINEETSQIVFELVGILDSTISYHLPGVEKKFTLKDSSGTIRCVFWEMDRKIPQLRRRSLIRCVGRMGDSSIFHCVSVRSIAPSEQSILQKFQQNCQQHLQRKMTTFNEV